jgi:hypothetical protein
MMPPPRPAGEGGPERPWVRAVRAGRPPAPVVLVIGGFLTSPPFYRGLAARLLTRGVAEVVVANVWTMDWLLAARRGLGPIVTRSGRALLEASARSERASLGAPVLVLGHSAGGTVARLLTSPEPFAGRRLNASGRIGAIVTIGTPHRVAYSHPRQRAAAEGAAFADRVVPGAAFDPTTGYLSIASRRTAGRAGGTLAERWAAIAYRELVPDPGAAEAAGQIEGDGLIPVESALLPGARQIVLDDADHGQFPRTPWYGSPGILDRWWPEALATWHDALQARVAGSDFDASGDVR